MLILFTKGYKGYKDGLQPESLADGNWLVKQNQPILFTKMFKRFLQRFLQRCLQRCQTRARVAYDLNTMLGGSYGDLNPFEQISVHSFV